MTIEGFIVRDSGADLGQQNAGHLRRARRRLPVAPRRDPPQRPGLQPVRHLAADGEGPRCLGNLITGKRDLGSAQRGNGIQLYNTTGAQIIGNDISFARDGIYVDVSHHAVFRGNRTCTTCATARTT